MKSLFTILIMMSLNANEIKSLTWEETTTNKTQMYLSDGPELSDEFDGIKVKLVNSTFDHTMSYAPKYLTFDYELESCPKNENFEHELTYKKKSGPVEIGKLKYWSANKSCKIFITLKTPFIGTPSIIYSLKESK